MRTLLILALLTAATGCATTPSPPADPAALVDQVRRHPANSPERNLAAAALADLGPSAAPHLVALVADDERALRFLAYVTLSRMGPAAAEAVPVLVERLRSGDGLDRFGCLIALRAMGPAARDAVPALIEVLDDDRGYPPLRTTAAQTLGAIGPDAHAAVPALAEGLRAEDRSGTYEEAGKEAIRRILEL